MNLSQLILAVGDDNVRFQNLDQCAIQLDWSRKNGSRITFGSPETIIPGEGTEKLGLILWFDRESVAAAIAKEKASQTPVQVTAEVSKAAQPLQTTEHKALPEFTEGGK